MTTPTFSPPKAPLTAPSKTKTYAVLTAEVGDGYVIRGKDGINNITHSYSITWPYLSLSEANAIEAFFDARAGAECFNYQVPGDSVSRKWITAPGSVQRQDFGAYSNMAATLQQVHDVT